MSSLARSGGPELLPDRGRSYGWARRQAHLLHRGSGGLRKIDVAGRAGFLEEWADEMASALCSQLIHRMAHAAKAALSRTPDSSVTAQ